MPASSSGNKSEGCTEQHLQIRAKVLSICIMQYATDLVWSGLHTCEDKEFQS
jgi:hypothetical protein